MRYGFIGLGHLGGHLAASLLRRRPVDRARSRSRRRRCARRGGRKLGGDARRGVAEADALITCLPSPARPGGAGRRAACRGDAAGHGLDRDEHQ